MWPWRFGRKELLAMDRDAKQMMRITGISWALALGLIVLGVLLAEAGGFAALRVLIMVIMGLAVANVMLMGLIWFYTQRRLDIPMVSGGSIALGCALLLIPGTAPFPSDPNLDDMSHASVAAALAESHTDYVLIRPGMTIPTPGGYLANDGTE